MTAVPGTVRRAPLEVTAAQEGNFGSHLLAIAGCPEADAEEEEDVVVAVGGGGDPGGRGGGGGRGVEVMAKLGFKHLSKVPPPVEAPGLE